MPQLPSKTWLKSKNPLSEAVRREREEEWDWDNVRGMVRDTVSRYLNKKTRRRPVVIPVVLEI